LEIRHPLRAVGVVYYLERILYCDGFDYRRRRMGDTDLQEAVGLKCIEILTCSHQTNFLTINTREMMFPMSTRRPKSVQFQDLIERKERPFTLPAPGSPYELITPPPKLLRTV
jgi:hypothetical protein